MATCPRCGRDAGDEFVCAECGAFLAGEDGETAAAVSLGRVALLVLIVCLLGAGGAVLLLRGNGGHNADLSMPPATSPVQLSSVPLGAPGTVTPSRSAHPTPSSSPSVSASRTRTSVRTSPAGSSSAAATSTRPSSTPRAPSSSTTPRPSPSRSITKPPSSTPAAPPPPAPSVHLAKGTLATCGPHCFPLVVTLTNFSAGSHTVNCFSSHGQFGSYSTTATTSSGCTFSRPNDTVYVVVDGHQSNAVIW